MKVVRLTCPNCEKKFTFRNKIVWILNSPFHTFTERLTRCPYCGKASLMKREK